MFYGELKARGLGARAAQHAIKCVVDAYAALRASVRAGNLGPEKSQRRRKAISKPIVFRTNAAHTYDDRCLSWNYDAQTDSIWTTDGRLKDVRFSCSASALRRLAEHRRGESDLLVRDGKWFLVATVDIAEAQQYEPTDWIGVDRGINNLATTSDGDNHSGRRLDRYRRRQARKRAEIQAKKTRSTKQLLKKRARREARHAAHTNHKISKTVVAVAQRTGRGIALEQLQGIRERVTVRRDQRARQSCWPFHQPGAFIAYKAQRAGVPFIEVDPSYTSQRCPRRGHNTFAITMAQRTRESALLRALGAGRRQIAGLVAVEALLVGGIATLAGLAGGLGCAQLLKALFSSFGMGLPVAGLEVTATTVLIAVPVGLLVTLLSALAPAVRASRVAPLAALREAAHDSGGPSPRRIVGAVVAAVSAGAVVAGALTGSAAMAGVGAAASLVAMVVLGPVAARPAAAVAGAPAARLRGVAGALARDPARTAGAATALMIGVGVVTLLTVFAGSMRASVEDGVAGSMRGGLVVNAAAFDTAVFVTLQQGASVTDARAALAGIAAPYGAPPVQDRDEYVAARTADMDAFVGIVYGMLALAIVIALLGIANTLSLAVHERTRELGLLRAVGATRGQVRSIVRWESVIVALFGTAGGAGLGVFLGWGLTRAMDDPFAAPAGTLAAIAVLGAVAGVLAAVRPARRAANRPVLESIASL